MQPESALTCSRLMAEVGTGGMRVSSTVSCILCAPAAVAKRLSGSFVTRVVLCLCRVVPLLSFVTGTACGLRNDLMTISRWVKSSPSPSEAKTGMYVSHHHCTERCVEALL